MVRRVVLVTLIVSGLGLVAMAGERREYKSEDTRHWDDFKRDTRAWDSFRHDDWKHHKRSTTSVPEPGSLLLLGTGLFAGWQSLKRIARVS